MAHSTYNKHQSLIKSIVHYLRHDKTGTQTLEAIAQEHKLNIRYVRDQESMIVDVLYYVGRVDIEGIGELRSELWEKDKTILILKDEIAKLKAKNG